MWLPNSKESCYYVNVNDETFKWLDNGLIEICSCTFNQTIVSMSELYHVIFLFIENCTRSTQDSNMLEGVSELISSAEIQLKSWTM